MLHGISTELKFDFFSASGQEPAAPKVSKYWSRTNYS